ncbi:hypothetical protein RYX36_008361 [Vicia faba]
MVGKGKVHNTLGDVLPHKLLPAGFLKVLIDISLDGDASLPMPDDVSYATLVGDVIGSYVTWSSNLIFIDDEIHAQELQQVNRNKKPEFSNMSKKTGSCKDRA